MIRRAKPPCWTFSLIPSAAIEGSRALRIRLLRITPAMIPIRTAEIVWIRLRGIRTSAARTASVTSMTPTNEIQPWPAPASPIARVS